MKRFILTLAVLAAVATSPLAARQSKLDFTLLNKTGVSVDYIYVSPTNDDEWGDDIMGRDVLEHGEAVDITFSRSEKSCMWDLKIKDEDGDEIEWSNLDLCKAEHITLNYEGGRPTATINR
jgi:hypothetical protein